MIRRADQNTAAREAIPLDLGDLLRQGESIKRAASEQAEKMLAAARAERDRLIAGAAAEGRARGVAKGLEEGRAKGVAEGQAQAAAEHRGALEALEKSWSEALAAFEAQRDHLLTEAREDVLKLALRIAHRVTHRLVQAEEGIAADQLEAVLALIARPTRLVITVHPDDLARTADALPALLQRFSGTPHAQIAPDPGLTRGSCVARAEGGGCIDASIETQLDRIAAALVPGRPSLSLAGTRAESPENEAA
jgi:flagellar biosynthesis/type III secretory pathway protein FliH